VRKYLFEIIIGSHVIGLLIMINIEYIDIEQIMERGVRVL
jgi:hypothetical protein